MALSRYSPADLVAEQTNQVDVALSGIERFFVSGVDHVKERFRGVRRGGGVLTGAYRQHVRVRRAELRARAARGMRFRGPGVISDRSPIPRRSAAAFR